MHEPSDAYSAKSDGTVQDTIYVLRLLDAGADYSTALVNGLSTTSLIMARPGGVTSKADPLTAQSSIGGVSMELLDLNGALTELRAAGPVQDTRAEVWQGYTGLPWDDYIPIIRGLVTVFDLDKPPVYSLAVADVFAESDIPVFAESAMAAEPYTTQSKEFDSGSLIISDEDGDEIYDTITLFGNPVDLGLKLLLSGGDAVSATYNVWPSWCGASLTEDQVDVDYCEAERDKIATVEMQLTIKGEESAKDIVEVEFCRALGGYTLLSALGKIRMHYLSSPVDTGLLAEVDDDEIVGIPSVKDSPEFYISFIDFSLDDTGDGPALKLPRQASDAYLSGAYKRERLHEISSRGLQTVLGGISQAGVVMDALFRRYAVPPPRAKFSTFFGGFHLAEAGDVLKMTATLYPDWDGQGTGATRLLEVLSVHPNVSRVDFDCIDLTGTLADGVRAAVIGPDGDLGYTLLADEATGLLGDGSAAFFWS